MTAPVNPSDRQDDSPRLYGGRPAADGSPRPPRRVTIRDLQDAKNRGEKWAMLTAYDALSARIFDDAGIPVLLVGDSAANVVYGYDSTVPVTVEELLPLVRAVTRSSRRALVVADLPFGSYQQSPQQALATAVQFLKDGGAHAVKLEGGERVIPHVELLVEAGIPVMAHLGLTPQSVNAFGGYRVQGRGESGEQLVRDAKALQQVGAFAVVLEVVPTDVAERVTRSLAIPTIGIGAGPGTDAQVLVWQDMAGLTEGPGPKFLRRYAELRDDLTAAAQQFADEVRDGVYPAAEHTYH